MHARACVGESIRTWRAVRASVLLGVGCRDYGRASCAILSENFFLRFGSESRFRSKTSWANSAVEESEG